MRKKEVPSKDLQDFYTLLASIETGQEAKMLSEDLFTPQEVRSFAQRWREIQLLAMGLTQRDIAQRLHVSMSKVIRGSRVLQYGSGGFLHFLRKLRKPVHPSFRKR